MRFTKRLSFLAAFAFIVVWAYAQDVHYNYSRGTNFQSYKTYKWVDLPDGVPDQLREYHIENFLGFVQLACLHMLLRHL